MSCMVLVAVVVPLLITLIVLGDRPRRGPRGQDIVDPRPAEPSTRSGPVDVQDLDD